MSHIEHNRVADHVVKYVVGGNSKLQLFEEPSTSA